MKVSRTNIFIFVLTFFLVLFFIVFYQVIKPSFLKKQYNFSPFPTVKPTDIPNYDIGGVRACIDKITACDPALGCLMCGDGSDFECTPVSDKENVFINDQKVNPGNWCLPKKGKDSKGCGTYTGRAIWSEKSSGATTEQKWSCVCLYPDLFAGDDCMKQLACKDSNILDDQKDNVLKSIDGHIWNPNDQSFDPQGKTPYDMDDNGDPLYSCDCNANNDTEDGVKFVQLPNDPYRCHAEPCTDDHKHKLWNKDQKMCNCSAIPDLKGYYAHSNVTGKCLLAGCEWDDQLNQCKCLGASSSLISVTCDSNTMKRAKYTDPITCPENPGGSNCKNPCVDTDGVTPLCGAFGTGAIDLETNTCKCTCHNEGIYNVSGVRCDKQCVKNGTKISGFKASQCCNGHHTHCSGQGFCDTPQCGPEPGGQCIGSSTVLQTSYGLKKLENIIPGEKILTWNIKNNTTEYQTVIGIYHHENVKTPHFEITTNHGDRIVISKNHNIYRSNSTLVQAWQLSVGDELKTINGFDIIKTINIIYDIPLTPIVIQGNVISGNGAVVSCWSGDEENVNLMNTLVKIIESYVETHTVDETSKMIQEAYTIFRDNSKSIDIIPELIRKYNIKVK